VTGQRSVRVRIPVRVDFAGGWSDVHYFSAREGGAALSAAIDIYVDGHAVADGERMELDYRTSVPRGSGLGGSAALDVAWLALTNGLMGRAQTAVELAEGAYRLEKVLGVEGGKQDQYASALGGFNQLRFGAEQEAAVVERLEPDAQVVAELEARLVLCYLGGARHSGDLHERVWAPFLEGDTGILAALREIRDSVEPGRQALLGGDLDGLAEIMSINREGARRLVPELVTPEMDALFEAGSEAGAIGSKACGAGGGGCLLFLCPAGGTEQVGRALQAHAARLLPFRFEPHSYWGDRAPDRP
jgi:D-glycero-alpha-D-manno-heptose-7-phosphate kinase